MYNRESHVPRKILCAGVSNLLITGLLGLSEFKVDINQSNDGENTYIKHIHVCRLVKLSNWRKVPERASCLHMDHCAKCLTTIVVPAASHDHFVK